VLQRLQLSVKLSLHWISQAKRNAVTCPKAKTGTTGQPISIAILTKPFLDLRKATCQLEGLFVIQLI
jgi:hypothetical protein